MNRTEIIKLKEANCKNCYRCIRHCPVKSIAFRSDQAEIISKSCILCGQCLLECPQNAKYINSGRETIQACMKRGEKLYVSLAPSFVSAFPSTSVARMSQALKLLGFAHVEETAIGAERVTREYEALIEAGTMPNIIATACPSTVLLVERHYPELIPFLAPVVSPMVAHARMMREVYGPRIKIVFIGPCIAKKHEVIDPENRQAVFAAMTFEQLADWFSEAGVDPATCSEDESQRTIHNTLPRFYPVPGGIIRNLNQTARRTYTCSVVDGIDRCQEILETLRDGQLHHHFLELNACAGSCLGGPALKSFKRGFLPSRQTIVDHVLQKPIHAAPLTEGTKTRLDRRFHDLSDHVPPPDARRISEILLAMGKLSQEQELNCGSCGYSSCRDKAAAVAQGKASIHMCLPYFRERAESMSNLVIENTPNAILVLDENYRIREFNPAASRILRMPLAPKVGQPVITVLPGDCLDLFNEDKHGIFTTVAYPEINLVVEQNLIPVADRSMFILILKDITREERAREKSARVRAETVEIAQSVILKQMRVAQEIASLLGETTAETKVALNQLKRSILYEMGDGLDD
ncbi:MAG: [Fe-Fe] hydrogenase large subunit C-terminal domain-containing protein [Eubacteriales bacterium]|nr:[Fe-Fe] hydrogenase large subunit C-terminal domain-containing protein [Eubacteriales bacterium]